MSNRVFVTGLGIISAIGNGVEETGVALEQSQPGLGSISCLDTEHKGIIPVCEVKYSNKRLHEIAEVKRRISRTALLGLIAAKEAWENAGMRGKDISRVGLISANSVGGMDRSELFFKTLLDNSKAGKLSDVVGHDCGDSSEMIADCLGIRDYVTTISTACSSSANAVMFGARLIKHKRLDRVMVGGCDALTRFTINGFNSLKILDPEGCKPFDEKRSGLNLGEGAAYLMLESEKAVQESNKEIICEVTGYANTCDAFHQTASSPDGDGPYQAMKEALEVAGIKAEEIDYINAHGTGTKNNDLSEGKAIRRIFADNCPYFSSTKPFTGHTLGAAGGIEAVLACLSINKKQIYPNLRWKHQMEDLDLKPVTKFMNNIKIKHVLSNSFGFGGNDTALIFSRC